MDPVGETLGLFTSTAIKVIQAEKGSSLNNMHFVTSATQRHYREFTQGLQAYTIAGQSNRNKE